MAKKAASNPKSQEMYFVRNMQWVQDPAVKKRVWEYQVTADADIIGDVTYGPYYFCVWELVFGDDAQKERSLCLRVETAIDDAASSLTENASRKGFYHGGGAPDEIVALCSLFLRRRLRLSSVVREDNNPVMYDVAGRGSGLLDPFLVQGQSNLGNLGIFFDLAAGLSPKLHQRFILSVKMYQQALARMEESPDIAYLNLVSAIEVLAGDFDIGKVKLAEQDAKLASLVDQIADEELRQKIEEGILEREGLISRRFVRFIDAHTTSEFWDDSSRPELGRVEPKDFKKLLKRIYGYRSKALHAGEPFPVNIYYPTHQGEEMPIGRETFRNEKMWTQNDYIPYPFFFERLVQHVLLNYLRNNQVSQTQRRRRARQPLP